VSVYTPSHRLSIRSVNGISIVQEPDTVPLLVTVTVPQYPVGQLVVTTLV
jgi:hypothetical protein